jgi:hypothetical protein
MKNKIYKSKAAKANNRSREKFHCHKTFLLELSALIFEK